MLPALNNTNLLLQNNTASSPNLDRIAAKQNKELEELRDATNQLEGLFMNQMLSAMRKTVQKSEFFNGGQAEESFTSMLDSEYTDMASQKDNGFGIGEAIYKQLSRQIKNTIRPEDAKDFFQQANENKQASTMDIEG